MVFAKTSIFEQALLMKNNSRANIHERSGHRGRSLKKVFGKPRNFENSNKLSKNRVCHYCVKSEHFIKFCRLRIAYEQSKPNKNGCSTYWGPKSQANIGVDPFGGARDYRANKKQSF